VNQPTGAVNTADHQRLRQYVLANLFVTSAASVGVLMAYLIVVRSGWLLVDCAIVAAVSLALALALVALAHHRYARTLSIIVIANWSAGLATTSITPFVLPMTSLTVLLPVVVLVPFLPRRRLAHLIVGAMVVAFFTTLVSRHPLTTDVDRHAPSWLIDSIMVLFIPVVVGLVALNAWQNHVRMTNQTAELRASRARLVGATDEVRRKLERDLHDGAQQHLIGVAIRLGLLDRLIDRQPEKARALAIGISTELQDTITELRDLAHGIYPSLLYEKGLAEALTAAAHRSPYPVVIDVPDTQRFRADIEAAVYFMCLEAMQNCAKHAPAAEMTIRVHSNQGLHANITDDGPGFDTTMATGGQGLTNMSDRIGAVGGHLTVTSTPGSGTRIVAFVPEATL
jgi:signal transduction histidine kinase